MKLNICTDVDIDIDTDTENFFINGAYLVVPSPIVSSCVLAISTSTLAAGFSTGTDLRIVAPSLVIVIRTFLGSDTYHYK